MQPFQQFSRIQAFLERQATHWRSLRRRLPVVVLLASSLLLGWGYAQATPGPNSLPEMAELEMAETEMADTTPVGTVDGVPPQYQLGQQIYLQACATCHVGLPPAVMPSETWQGLILDPSHYGTQITPTTQPYLTALWSYLSTYSRPRRKDEATPYRLYQSRYFKALHPKVPFTEPVTLHGCATCHPAAAQFDFRSLSPEWQNAP